MHARLSRYVMVLLSSLFVAGNAESSTTDRTTALQAQSGGTNVNADARVLADFKSRIDKYMALHNRLKKEAPPLKETKEPAEIKASQEVLAKKIRDARKDAKPGEIFTPEIRQVLRRLMYPETKGTDGAENKAAMAEEKQELKGVTLKVNA